MKWIAAVLALLTFSAQGSQCPDMTQDQRKVLVAAYNKGQPHDLGYTMMAIAWNESSAGKYRVNIETHDFGVMQNSLKTAAVRTNTKGYYNKMRLIEDLIKNDDLSMSLALEELLYWKNQTGTWRHMVSAYNNGWRYKSGNEYLTKIIKNVKMFQRCLGGLMEKLEYLNKLQEKYPMPQGATHVYVPDDVSYIGNNRWRKEGAYYNPRAGWVPFNNVLAAREVGLIPLEFLMDRYLEADV